MINLDFNQAEEQSAGFEPIPNNSVVWVFLQIQYPEQGRSGSMQELTASKKSTLEYMSTKLLVANGAFKGKELYHNFNLNGASNKNQETAIRISMSQLRAIVEAKNQISPKDTSARASALRVISSFSELQNACFPVKVSCEIESGQDGKQYIRNNVKKIISVDDEEYALSAQTGELLTDEPIPVITQAAATSNAPSALSAPPLSAPPVQAPPMQAPFQNSMVAQPQQAPAQQQFTQTQQQAPQFQAPVQNAPAQQGAPNWAAAAPQQGGGALEDMPF